jgi:hypothetical protein
LLRCRISQYPLKTIQGGLTVALVSHLLHSSTQVLSHVIDEVLLLVLLSAKDFPELPHLHIVVVRDLGLEIHDRANPLLMCGSLFVLRGLNDLGLEVAGQVVGRRSVVGGVAYAVAASGVVGIEWLVYRYVIEVYTKSVSLSLTVGKETDLEN